jgi:uncharacterized membrane protein
LQFILVAELSLFISIAFFVLTLCFVLEANWEGQDWQEWQTISRCKDLKCYSSQDISCCWSAGQWFLSRSFYSFNNFEDLVLDSWAYIYEQGLSVWPWYVHFVFLVVFVFASLSVWPWTPDTSIGLF